MTDRTNTHHPKQPGEAARGNACHLANMPAGRRAVPLEDGDLIADYAAWRRLFAELMARKADRFAIGVPGMAEAYEDALDRLARHVPQTFEGLLAMLEAVAEITAQREIDRDGMLGVGPVFRMATNAICAIGTSAGDIPHYNDRR